MDGMRKDRNKCYEFITGLLNKHYRDNLLEIDEVKRGKFILEFDPECGDPKITFLWWNDFGLEEPDEITEEWENNFDKIYDEELHPAKVKVWERIDEIKDEFVDGFYPHTHGFHEIREKNYELGIEEYNEA